MYKKKNEILLTYFCLFPTKKLINGIQFSKLFLMTFHLSMNRENVTEYLFILPKIKTHMCTDKCQATALNSCLLERIQKISDNCCVHYNVYKKENFLSRIDCLCMERNNITRNKRKKCSIKEHHGKYISGFIIFFVSFSCYKLLD